MGLGAICVSDSFLVAMKTRYSARRSAPTVNASSPHQMTTRPRAQADPDIRKVVSWRNELVTRTEKGEDGEPVMVLMPRVTIVDARQPDRWSWRPQEGSQYALVICPLKEIFFGGTRGGGKADARSAATSILIP